MHQNVRMAKERAQVDGTLDTPRYTHRGKRQEVLFEEEIDAWSVSIERLDPQGVLVGTQEIRPSQQPLALPWSGVSTRARDALGLQWEGARSGEVGALRGRTSEVARAGLQIFLLAPASSCPTCSTDLTDTSQVRPQLINPVLDPVSESAVGPRNPTREGRCAVLVATTRANLKGGVDLARLGGATCSTASGSGCIITLQKRGMHSKRRFQSAQIIRRVASSSISPPLPSASRAIFILGSSPLGLLNSGAETQNILN